MDAYQVAMTAHVILATVLFGTGLGIAFFFIRRRHMGDLRDVNRALLGLVAVVLGCVAALVSAEDGQRTLDTWSGPAQSFRVVGETGDPLSGAIALMNWPLIGPVSTTPLRQLHAFEVQTGSDGMVRVPMWGPVPVPPNTSIPEGAPRLSVFKPGYFGVFKQNGLVPRISGSRGSVPLEWDGTTIVLEQADRESQAYRDNLLMLRIRLGFFGRNQQCLSDRFHLTIDAYNAEYRRLNPSDDTGMSIGRGQDGCRPNGSSE